MVKITEKAKSKVIELMSESGYDGTYFLRVGVKGGGCSGLTYIMDFDKELKNGDEVFEDDGVRIVCDKRSLIYLIGTELHHSDGLNGKGFEWINPNAIRTCGCGESFST